MKINVKAKPRAYTDKVEKIDEQNFVVSVTEPPVQGRANAAIVKILADYFHVAPSRVRLLSGFTSQLKTFDIDL